MSAEERAENLKPKLLQLYRHTTDVNSTIIEIAAALVEYGEARAKAALDKF